MQNSSERVHIVIVIRKDKFYSLENSGDIMQSVRLSEKDVFGHSSYLKNKVEEHKTESDMIAHT